MHTPGSVTSRIRVVCRLLALSEGTGHLIEVYTITDTPSPGG